MTPAGSHWVVWIASLLVMPGLGCTSERNHPPESPTESAEHIFSADLNGDGQAEMIVADGGTLFWGAHIYIYKGGIHASASLDLDGDKRDELVLGLGRSKTHPKAPASVLVIDSDRAQVHPLNLPKHRISDLKVAASGLYLTAVGPNKGAVGGWWTPEGFSPTSKGIMALTQVPLPNGQTALGCLYGEEPRSHGGLFLHNPDGTTTRLPSLRGVRSLATADINNDGHLDLVSADGWHFRYGADARARLNLYLGPDFSDHRVLGEIQDNYTINQIEVIQVDGEGPQEILAVGTTKIALFRSDSVGWSQTVVGEADERTHVITGGNPGQIWAAISGKPIEFIQFSPR